MKYLIRFVFWLLVIPSALIVLASVVFLVFSVWPRYDPADEAPKPIQVTIGMTVREFIAVNGVRIGPQEPNGYTIDADKLVDWMPIMFTDNWIIPKFTDGAQSFTMPPGRTLHISQLAGRITGVAFRPFDFPKPLSEVTAYADQLIGELRASGWRASGKAQVPRSVEDLDFAGKALFGEHISANGSILQINIRDYGLAPISESWIIDPFAAPLEETRTYLLQVTLDEEARESYSERIYPRRIFLNGNQKDELPMRAWIDDPDWTPQSVGMVPVPPEKRAPIDATDCVMPEKGALPAPR
ncbi:hypothetical protein [Rhizobium sp. Leaf262]|uniref:hypothetical protein n=1 Tax=Rhizobium sp. Leaf262 TaxID=1736312 RepID=UPI000713E758|nr:hypothetical protein [Rhizobium sp. Leaf262]KQO76087.1 hypothetical protein ASF29_08770 [Rhizobium sp. Leaf262]